MPSPDPEPMVESWWRLADKGDGLVRVETVESLPESNKADLTSVHHDKRYENARSVLVTLAYACDAQRGVAESRVLTSDRMAEGDVLSKASIETGREALPFGGDYIPFAYGRVDPAWVKVYKVPAHAVAGLELLYAQARPLTGPRLEHDNPNRRLRRTSVTRRRIFVPNCLRHPTDLILIKRFKPRPRVFR